MRHWLVVILLALHVGHAHADEVERIRTHLRAARQLLDTRDTSTLSPRQRENRAAAIVVLDHYIERGVFPRRTSDNHGRLRPRFIDDRGVHCAVGEMIAKTGSPELALLINANHEYAFVREIKMPELMTWADDHGLTVNELAAIQPAYAKPDRALHDVDELTLRCMGEEALPAQVTLMPTHEGGTTRFSTDATDEFSRCFAAGADKLVEPRRFAPRMIFHVPSLNDLVQSRLVPAECAPRIGAFPREATIDFAKASVTTQPANEEVNSCLVGQLERSVEPFRRRLKVQSHISIPASITDHGVESILLDFAPRAAWKCVAEREPERIDLVVRAKEGDTDFVISIPGANAKYTACVSANLSVPLRALLKAFPAHRVDSNVEATLTFRLDHQARY